MNSTLQSLIYAAPLQKFLLGNNHEKCTRNGFCPMCALQEVCRRVLKGSKAVAPKTMALNLKRISKQFRFGRQEDSHEFLRFLLDGIHEMYMPRPKMLKHDSPITNIFGGTFESRIKCLHCSEESVTIDQMMDVSLNIRHCNSMLQAFKKFTEAENLLKDNRYKCENCNQLRDARKQTLLGKLPPVLTVQLKRFGFSKYGSKVTNFVSFPEILDAAPFTAGSHKYPIKYRLFAVLVHSGHSCTSGHYYTHVKAGNEKWYRIDDCSVSQVQIQTVLKQNAYMLFYEKLDDVKSKEQQNSIAKSEDPTNSSDCLSDESTLAEGSQQISPKSSLTGTQGAKVSTNQKADSRGSRHVGQDDVPLCSKLNSTIKWTVTISGAVMEDANRVHTKGSNVSINNEDRHLRLNGSALLGSSQFLTGSRELDRTSFARCHQTSPNTKYHTADLPRIPSENIPKMDFKQALASRDTIESTKKSLNFGHSTWRKKPTYPKEKPLNSKKTKIRSSERKNDFLVELQSNSSQNNPILPWDSVQNSEIIKKRGLLEQDSKPKLKRPSQDDLLYDAPKYKKKSSGF